MPEDWEAGGFGVYVHWPFCAAKCPYCDFNSHVRDSVDQESWRKALVKEIYASAELTPGRTVGSIFFGGGTPSLMPPDTVAAIIEAVGNAWTLAPGAEISMEANPTSVEAGRFQAYREGGVNRLSMGIQALNDPDLKALGRMHSAKEAIGAFDIARKAFDRVSFDLICARQNQTVDAWRSELRRALDLAVDHLSLYQLTIEPNTRFGEMASRGSLRGLPTGDLSADIYDATQDLCAAAGMIGYEVSNHAHPGSQCQHNLLYWRYGDYVGVGPGAHGRLTINGRRQATTTNLSPESWLDGVSEQQLGSTTYEPLSDSDQATEMLMMGMRLNEGVDVLRFETLAGKKLNQNSIEFLIEMSFIELNENKLRATRTGRPVLNSILNTLLNQ